MKHAVRTLPRACRGCVNCIKVCPTEAMRLYYGKVGIMSELCIDCGECIKACPSKAITINEDNWDMLRSLQDKIVIADPVFYTQFPYLLHPGEVSSFLRLLGFDDLVELMYVAYDLVAYSIAMYIKKIPQEARPLISVYCPAVLRLVQVKYPELVSRLIPVDTPLEVAVRILKEKNKNLKGKKIVLLSPCPAKTSMVHAPEGLEKSEIDYSVGINWAYRELINITQRPSELPEPNGWERWINWAVCGGETKHVSVFWEDKKEFRGVVVSGVRNIKDVLNEIELGKLKGVDFVECRMCDHGCVGGVCVGESRFIASLVIPDFPRDWKPSTEYLKELDLYYQKGISLLPLPLRARPRAPLSDNLQESMRKLSELQSIYEKLPGIDCGSCGRPTCRALAEDIIMGKGDITDCIFKQRERIIELAKEIVDLSMLKPHAIKK